MNGNNKDLPPNTEMEDGLLWTIRPQYKWAQTVYDVQVKVQLPSGTRGSLIDWKATASTIRFGLKGQSPILEGELDYKIKPGDSTWSLDPDEGEAILYLQKAIKHENWKSVLKGVGVVDPLTSEEMGKKMLLEKFSAENPGFDFSGAQFNGALPSDPKNFCPGSRPY